jgi:PhnB protein
MPTLNAYLSFNGNAREAMTFYKECLGGELELMTIGGSPMEQYMPDAKDNIVHSTLRTDWMVLNGSDMAGPEGIQTGSNVSLMIQCDTEDQLRDLYAKLSKDGNPDHPPAPAFWGGTFGHLIDKFGVIWLLNHSNEGQA